MQPMNGLQSPVTAFHDSQQLSRPPVVSTCNVLYTKGAVIDNGLPLGHINIFKGRTFLRHRETIYSQLSHSLLVPYQSGSSRSSPLSSGSNPEPAVNLSHGMFHSRLKTYLFSKYFPP